METYKNCQSCGMPLKRDPQGGGTNADGSKSGMYCSLCYTNGQFTFNGTAQEMQAFSTQKLKEMGFPGFLARWMAKGIPKLKRWQH